MNWLVLSTLAGIGWLALKPKTAATPEAPPAPPAPAPLPTPPGGADPIPVSNGTLDPSTDIVTPASPVTVARTATVDGRDYQITRAGLGVYRVVLASDPNVSYEFDQTGPLRSTGDAAKIKQLQADISKFPSTLFTT